MKKSTLVFILACILISSCREGNQKSSINSQIKTEIEKPIKNGNPMVADVGMQILILKFLIIKRFSMLREMKIKRLKNL
ncbi:hypothetical protein [Jejuia pallidilutea]|uniref:hypothetical protein n=1 Tax=Jejuia pallidilutea TaxID=504487 RepID=UPI0005A6900F|nr:hypothetical protein [Jejuia pallidilutea]